MCLTPSLLPWNQTTQEMLTSWGGTWLQLHGIQLEATRGSKMGLETREQFT